jgi:hypothetical protein
MSYCLARTEDDAEVQRVADEVQRVYDVHGKQESVEWAGKMLMPRLHAQMAMERVDAMRVEQDVIEEERYQAEWAQREEERATKESELEERETEYIQQLNVKEIDEDRFRELVGELDVERAWARVLRRVWLQCRRPHRTKRSGRASERSWRRKNRRRQRRVSSRRLSERGRGRRRLQGLRCM